MTDIKLSIDDIERLGQKRPYASKGERKHCFWAISMPDPNSRHHYYEAIREVYRSLLEPRIEYQDAYSESIQAGPVFNVAIQRYLIETAIYLVIDYSGLRANVMFEAGFGLGAGMTVLHYYDCESPLRPKGIGPTKKAFWEFKRRMPPQLCNALFRQPSVRIPAQGRYKGRVDDMRKLAKWFDGQVHVPGMQLGLQQRRCCVAQSPGAACAYQSFLDRLKSMSGGKLYLARFQKTHVDKEDFVRQQIQSYGYTDVETVGCLPSTVSPSARCASWFRRRTALSLTVRLRKTTVWIVRRLRLSWEWWLPRNK